MIHFWFVYIPLFVMLPVVLNVSVCVTFSVAVLRVFGPWFVIVMVYVMFSFMFSVVVFDVMFIVRLEVGVIVRFSFAWLFVVFLSVSMLVMFILYCFESFSVRFRVILSVAVVFVCSVPMFHIPLAYIPCVSVCMFPGRFRFAVTCLALFDPLFVAVIVNVIVSSTFGVVVVLVVMFIVRSIGLVMFSVIVALLLVLFVSGCVLLVVAV